MEPNEMVRYELYSEGWYSAHEEEDKDGNWVRYEDAMQIITALQEKIDGMIERPTIGIRVVEREGFPTRYLLRLNEFPIDVYHSLDSAEATGELLTTALGMDDSTNTKEPQ